MSLGIGHPVDKMMGSTISSVSLPSNTDIPQTCEILWLRLHFPFLYCLKARRALEKTNLNQQQQSKYVSKNEDSSQKVLSPLL